MGPSSDDQNELQEVPAGRPRQPSKNVLVSPTTFEGAPEEGKRRGRWTMEGTGAWAAVVIGLLAAFGAGAMWVGSVAKDVAEIQAWKAAHTADSENRLRQLEFTQHDSAGDMKVVLERLTSIDSKLVAVGAAINAQPQRLQPRNRPIHAHPRVDSP